MIFYENFLRFYAFDDILNCFEKKSHKIFFTNIFYDLMRLITI